MVCCWTEGLLLLLYSSIIFVLKEDVEGRDDILLKTAALAMYISKLVEEDERWTTSPPQWHASNTKGSC